MIARIGGALRITRRAAAATTALRLQYQAGVPATERSFWFGLESQIGAGVPSPWRQPWALPLACT
jgi:hypothetical protein